MLAYFAHGYRHITERVQSNWRPNWEFFAVFEGQCAPVFGDDDTPDLQETTLWVFSPDCRHGWIANPRRPILRMCLHFGFVPQPLEALVRSRGNHYAKTIGPDEIHRLRSIASELEPHARRPTVLSPLHVTARLMDLSLLVLSGSNFVTSETIANAAVLKVERALAWYADHLADCPTVGDVADAIHISLSHLRRLFWQVRRSSPRAMFQKIRIQRAQELMNGSTATLEEIARRCGYTDASHLCREYKKHYAFTPTFWRRHKVISFTKPHCNAS